MGNDEVSITVWRWVVLVLTALTLIWAAVVTTLTRLALLTAFEQVGIELPLITLLMFKLPLWPFLLGLFVLVLIKEWLLKNEGAAIAVNAVVANAVILALALYLICVSLPWVRLG